MFHVRTNRCSESYILFKIYEIKLITADLTTFLINIIKFQFTNVCIVDAKQWKSLCIVLINF